MSMVPINVDEVYRRGVKVRVAPDAQIGVISAVVVRGPGGTTIYEVKLNASRYAWARGYDLTVLSEVEKLLLEVGKDE